MFVETSGRLFFSAVQLSLMDSRRRSAMICKTFAGEKKKDNNNNYNNKTHGPFIIVYALKPVKHDTSVKILLQNP